MFKQRIDFFKGAVYELTGYKLDITGGIAESAKGEGQVTVRSMFAEREDDYLKFSISADGVAMLDTPFAGRLGTATFAYLDTVHSIPAFLSRVTLDLFESQTFQT
jgi:hypothetical protein